MPMTRTTPSSAPNLDIQDALKLIGGAIASNASKVVSMPKLEDVEDFSDSERWDNFLPDLIEALSKMDSKLQVNGPYVCPPMSIRRVLRGATAGSRGINPRRRRTIRNRTGGNTVAETEMSKIATMT